MNVLTWAGIHNKTMCAKRLRHAAGKYAFKKAGYARDVIESGMCRDLSLILLWRSAAEALSEKCEAGIIGSARNRSTIKQYPCSLEKIWFIGMLFHSHILLA